MTTALEQKLEKFTARLTEEAYQEHVDSMDGVCLGCGKWRYGDTEGDAENYPCDSCGENHVMGTEMALIAGHLEIQG